MTLSASGQAPTQGTQIDYLLSWSSASELELRNPEEAIAVLKVHSGLDEVVSVEMGNWVHSGYILQIELKEPDDALEVEDKGK